MIKSIPLCTTSVVDTLIWPFNASGTYIAKSGYKFLAKEELHSQFPAHSDHNSDLWKLIWGLDVPKKNKKFYMEVKQGCDSSEEKPEKEEDIERRQMRSLWAS